MSPREVVLRSAASLEADGKLLRACSDSQELAEIVERLECTLKELRGLR